MSNLLIGDYSFESGVDNWYCSQTNEKPTHKEGDAVHGRYSMQLNGTSVEGRWYYHLIEPNTDYVLSFYAKGKKGDTIKVFCRDCWDELGKKEFELTDEWQRYSLPLIRQTRVRNFWMTIQTTGTVLLDAFQLEKGTETTPYTPAEPVGIYASTNAPSEMYVAEKDGELHYSVSICSFLPSLGNSLTAEIEIKRFGDIDAIFKNSYLLELDEYGIAKLDIPLEVVQTEGYYPVFIRIYDKKGNLVIEKEEPFAVAADFPEDFDRDFFGMHSSRVSVEAQRRIGVGWVRFGAPAWQILEPEKGKLVPFGSANWHSKGIKRLTAIHGISAPPAWTTKKGTLPAKGEEVEAMAQHVIDRLNDDTDFYEMENEPDLTMSNAHNVSTEEAAHIFAEMARSIGKVVHKNGGRLSFNVSGGGHEAMLFSEVAMREAAEAFDGYAPHLYSWPRYVGEKRDFVSTPEEADFVGQIKNSQELLDRYGGNQELFIGEYGFALDYDASCNSIYAGLHAAYITRSYLLGMSVPEMKRIFYFTDYYCVEDRYDYGLWRANCRPLPAASAFATCALMTGGSVCKTHVAGPDFYILEFVRENKSVFAMWNCNQKAERELREIRITTSDVTGRTMTGTPVQRAEGILSVGLGPFPVYLEADKAQSETLLAELQRELIRVQPYTMTVTRTEKQSLTVTLKPVDAMKECYCDTLTVSVGEEQISCDAVVEPNQETVLKVSFKTELPLKGIAVRVTAQSNGNEFVKMLPPLLICQKIETDDWRNFDYLQADNLIVLDKRIDVAPPDSDIGWKGPEDLSAKIFCGWDEKNLYFMLRVRDDIHCQPVNDEYIWRSDCVQIGLDLGNDAVCGGYDSKNDYEFGMALPESGQMVWCWVSPQGKETGKMDLPIQIIREADITEYRIALPWDYLTGEKPEKGVVFGAGIVIPDDDGSGTRFRLQTDAGVVGTKRPYLFSKLILTDSEGK